VLAQDRKTFICSPLERWLGIYGNQSLTE